MKAIFFEKHGGPEVLRYADLPDPELEPGHALVRVKAASLNHLDIWVRRGWRGLHLELPHITGSDVAGELVEVGPNSQPPSGGAWNAGDRVVVNPGINLFQDEWTRTGQHSLSPGYRVLGEQIRGGLAEYVVVPTENIFRLPEEVPFDRAAAGLLVGVTAWRMLFHCANLQPGQSILIVGAGGGVNSVTTAIAKKCGATVYCLTSSEEKIRKARDLGADEVLNYKKTSNWHAEILRMTKGRGVDIVIDNVGQATIQKSLRAVTRGGKIVTVGNTSGHEIAIDNRVLFTKQISLIGSTMGSQQDFIDSMNFMLKHDVKVPIDRVEPLSNGIEMLQYLEEGKQFGKIVLTTD